MALYSSIYSGPPRHYGSTRTDKRYIAIHNTSNDATAEGEASYAKRREDSVSSHYYVDNDSILQSLDTNLRAVHAGSSTGNSQAISYEITGTNGKSRAWWLDNVAWLPLARQIAVDMREHDIAPQLLTVEQIKAGKLTGIITHNQMRLAWGGTTHTDPGPNFPMDHLLGLVVAEMEADMAITDEDIERIARKVANWDFKNGPGEDPAYVVANRAAAAAVAAADGVKVLDGKLAAVAGKVDALAAPDLDVLADKVADRLVAKLNLGFVPATPPAQG